MKTYSIEEIQAVRKGDRALSVECELESMVDRLTALKEGAQGKERDAYRQAIGFIFDAWQTVTDYRKSLPIPQETVTKKGRKVAA